MSRIKRVLHSMASAYAVLAANALFSLAAVPLALFYLNTEEFGLWALIVQLVGYLSLIDLGMSAAVARLLVDYKDAPDGRDYGSVILTGGVVLLIQGMLVLLAGLLFSPTLAAILQIPPDLSAQFVLLMRWQCGITAFGFAGKIFGHMLAAHQRNDIVNYGQLIFFAVNLCLQWIGFKAGWKLFSLPVASAGSTLLSAGLPLWACAALGLYPRRGTWGRPTWKRFGEMFAFGKDVFLVSIGVQLIATSQTVIVTRTMGLTSSAVWSVCTKTFSLVLQLIWRLFDFSAYTFCEMLVREEHQRLFERFRDVVMLTGSLSGAAAVVFAVCNGPFVAAWTGERLAWSVWNNVLLGIWLVLVSVVRCHTTFSFVTKTIRLTGYIYLIEGVAFVAAASFSAGWGGFTGIIAASILCSGLFSGIYGLRRTTGYFPVTAREVVLGWSRPLLRVLVRLVPWAALVMIGSAGLPAKYRLLVNGLSVGVPAGYLLLRHGISRRLQLELLQRAPPQLNLLLKRILPAV